MNDQNVTVSQNALKQVLQALNGPDYLIRELQAIRPLGRDNPIDILIDDYNKSITKNNAERGG